MLLQKHDKAGNTLFNAHLGVYIDEKGGFGDGSALDNISNILIESFNQAARHNNNPDDRATLEAFVNFLETNKGGKVSLGTFEKEIRKVLAVDCIYAEYQQQAKSETLAERQIRNQFEPIKLKNA